MFVLCLVRCPVYNTICRQHLGSMAGSLFEEHGQSFEVSEQVEEDPQVWIYSMYQVYRLEPQPLP